ncbi:MAG: prepilin peptidase [Gammaproteobacteria bacterium]|nr:prepilin peptidase [Gammaproteobacteria bacterium]
MTIIELIQTNQIIFLSLIFLLGLIVGSFLNVVIYRFPTILQRQWQDECCEYLSETEPAYKTPCQQTIGQREHSKFSLSYPNSTCPHCSHKIRFYENIPVISWLFLKGQCSSCQNTISIRYPLVELLTGFVSVVIGFYFGATILCLSLLILSWSLIAMSLIDYDTQLLPDDMTLPIMWLGLLISLFDWSLVYPEQALIGAIAGYLCLWTVFHIFKLATGKEGMGYGDFKLLALLGAWMGWQSLPMIILLSSLSGAVIGLSVKILKRQKESIPIPFGPYLSIAGFLALVWGKDITQAYYHFIGLSL